jgi:O-antigen ligase
MILLAENFSLDNYDRELVGSSSNAARLYLLSFSYESFKTHPVIGIGTGNFKKEIEKFSRSDDGKVHGAHNEYQRILVENGLVGLAIYFLIIWMLFIGMKRIKVSALSKGIMYKYHYLLISAVFIYGSIINAFLGGGALNIFFYVVPLALIASYRKDLRNKLNLSYKK